MNVCQMYESQAYEFVTCFVALLYALQIIVQNVRRIITLKVINPGYKKALKINITKIQKNSTIKINYA